MCLVVEVLRIERVLQTTKRNLGCYSQIRLDENFLQMRQLKMLEGFLAKFLIPTLQFLSRQSQDDEIAS